MLRQPSRQPEATGQTAPLISALSSMNALIGKPGTSMVWVINFLSAMLTRFRRGKAALEAAVADAHHGSL